MRFSLRLFVSAALAGAVVSSASATRCGGELYCPASSVTRGQMAVFLVTTFGLP